MKVQWRTAASQGCANVCTIDAAAETFEKDLQVMASGERR